MGTIFKKEKDYPRPLHQIPKTISLRPNVTIYKGPLSIEVHQEFNDYISQVTRIYSGMADPESEWLAGPIPISDGIGKEIISKYSTDLNTKGTFYTDANGRQMMKRVRDKRPTWDLNVTEPVAGNYYPINSRMYIKDDASDQQFTILTDRSQGGSSMQDGGMEIMIHRRLLYDDAFGVGEPLNESAYGQGLVVRGKNWLQFEIGGDAAAAQRHRFKAQELFMDTILTFIPTTLSYDEWHSKFNMYFSALEENEAIPKNIHVLTLEEWKRGEDSQIDGQNSVLLRLEHLFEVQEDRSNMSKPVLVNLEVLFKAFDILSVEEVTLGANLRVEKLHRLQWDVMNEVPTSKTRQVEGGEDVHDVVEVENGGWPVTMQP